MPLQLSLILPTALLSSPHEKEPLSAVRTGKGRTIGFTLRGGLSKHCGPVFESTTPGAGWKCKILKAYFRSSG